LALQLQTMEQDRKVPRRPRGILVLTVAVAVVVLAALGGVLVLRHSDRSPTPGRSPAALTVPTTAAYNARPGPGGTRLLTEPVDPLTLAVPVGWTSPPADGTLSDAINSFAGQAPALAVLLRAEAQVAVKAAVRLFAYQAGAPNAFVSVVSFSAPGAAALTPASIAAIMKASQKLSKNVAVSGVQLPAGQALKLDSSLVSQKKHVVVEVVVLVSGGRTIEVEMVSETSVAGIPPLFAQLAQSIRLG
jgi:hypothetical protein